MAENLFQGGLAELQEIRTIAEKREALEAAVSEKKAQKAKVEKSVQKEEKSIKDEIASTIKDRRKDLEKGFDKKLSANHAEQKKVQSQRGKQKSQAVDVRMMDETKHVRQNAHDLKMDLRSVFKRDNVPAIFRTRWFYNLFMPYGVGEIVRFLLAFVIWFVAIPVCGTLALRKWVFKGTDSSVTLLTIIIPVAWIILWLVIYFIIYINTKMRYIETMKEGRSILNAIRLNEREERSIKRKVKRDKDESGYELDEYDEKLKALEQEASAIMEEQKAALKSFDEENVPAITTEINERRIPKLEEMKAELAAFEEDLAATEKECLDVSAAIANQYSSFIGEENCRTAKLDVLMGYIRDGAAANIGEAIALTKNGKASRPAAEAATTEAVEATEPTES